MGAGSRLLRPWLPLCVSALRMGRDLGNCSSRSPVGPQARTHAVAISCGSVLASLEFSNDTGHLDLETDNGAQHGIDIVTGRIADMPAICAPLLVNVGQFG